MRRKSRANISWLAIVFVLFYAWQQFMVSLVAHNQQANSNSFFTPQGEAGYSEFGTNVGHPNAVPKIDFEAEYAASVEYVDSIKSTRRDLTFLHIPKAAGSSVEQVGGVSTVPKMSWGSCRFNHRPKRRGNVCAYPPGQFEWPTKIGYWHLPPQLFPLMGVNPYESNDLFAVIRPPAERLLSEFYYICKRKRTKHADRFDCDPTRMHDAQYMNDWIQRKMLSVNSTLTAAQPYFDENGHFTPQYSFLVANFDIRMVDYVIPMDELKQHYDKLMAVHGIQSMMASHRMNAARNSTDLGVADFDDTTSNLLHERYRQDLDVLFPSSQTK